MIIHIVIISLLSTIDRIIKFHIVNSKQAYRLFSWMYLKGSYNTGLALNFLYNNKFVFYIVSISFLFLLTWIITNWYQKKTITGLLFIGFGGASNLFDRYIYGAVIDYIRCSVFSIPLPVFNIADILIIIGVIITLFSLLQTKTKQTARNA